MDMFERFNTKFGKWYEGFFGTDSGELRPKDVLRKITTAMEDNRKEGFDSKIYVPNKYVLELAVTDPEEKDYLLSFLDEEELSGVLKKFMTQNGYHIRGPLDFTIAELSAEDSEIAGQKLRVKVRFEKGEINAAPVLPANRSVHDMSDDDMATVAGTFDDLATIPGISWGAFTIVGPDGRKQHFSLLPYSITIGRSRHVGNDLVLDGDGMVSKTHARVDRESDGKCTVYDEGSTNGLLLNGKRVEGNAVVLDGDVITIGGTTLSFQASGDGAPAAAVRPTAVTKRARLVDQSNQLVHVLASETLIGRSVTSDIVLQDSAVEMKHARIVAPDTSTYYLEALCSGTILVNGQSIYGLQNKLLNGGDVITVGRTLLKFQGSE